MADEREFELENTPDEQERKKKIKEWKEEAGECSITINYQIQ